MTSRLRLWQVVGLVYGLMVLTLVGLLVWQGRPETEPAALARVVQDEAQGRTRLRMEGTGLHAGLRGVLAATSVDAEAAQWRVLDNVIVRNLAVSDQEDLALISCFGTKLISLALSGDNAPVVLGSLDMPGRVEQIRIVGDLAVVGMGKFAGVALVDLREPQAMQIKAVLQGTDIIVDMAIAGQVVYLVDWGSRLLALNLAEKPAKLTVADALESPWRVAVNGNRLVVCSLAGSVHHYEITGHGQVKKTGVFDLHRNIRDLAMVEETLAIALEDGRLHLYSLSGWPTVAPMAVVTLSDTPMRMVRVPGREALAVSLVAAGIVLVDVASPDRPVVSGHLKVPQTYYDMEIRSEVVYVSGYSGFEAFPLEAIATARLPAGSQVSDESEAFSYWNGQVFASRDEALTRVGRSTVLPPSMEPFLVIVERGKVVFFAMNAAGLVSPPVSLPAGYERVEDALWLNGRLYLLHAYGFDILTGDTPAGLIRAGSLAQKDLALNKQAIRLARLGPDLLMIVGRNLQALIVDVADPGQPRILSRLPSVPPWLSNRVTHEVLIAGQRAYLSAGASGILIFDLSVPAQPRLLQVIDTPGVASGMALHDGLLLVADSTQGVFIVDVKETDHALPVGSLPTAIRARQIAVVDDGLLISSNPGGTMKLPLPQRLADLRIVNDREALAKVAGRVPRGQVYLYDAVGMARAGVGTGGNDGD